MKSCSSLNNLITATLLLVTASMTNGGELSGHISGYLGLKSMDSSEWPEIDRHFAAGVLFDLKKDSWPISIALDIMDTGAKHENDGMKELGHTTEFQLGVRKIFNKQDSKIQPYVGGGASFMYAEQEYQANNTIRKQDDRDIGVWLGTGMYYEINPKFVLGLDLRYSHGTVTLFDEERDAGGLYTGITAGYQF